MIPEEPAALPECIPQLGGASPAQPSLLNPAEEQTTAASLLAEGTLNPWLRDKRLCFCTDHPTAHYLVFS